MGVDGRPTEQEALHLVAAEVCQRLELLDALDPLRHGDQAVLVCGGHGQSHQPGVGPVGVDPLDEAAVDLELVQRQLPQ